MPLWFLVDKDGIYYLQWTIARDGIMIDNEGILQHRFTPQTLETEWIYEASVGKDGQIYVVYSNSDGKIEIGRLDTRKCVLENGNPALCFSGGETFSAMSGGTDTNHLLFSPYSGVWAYDGDNGTIENRIPLSGLGFDPNAEIYPFAFLPDGRLVLLGKTLNDNNGSTVNDADDGSSRCWLLKYISAGK